MWDKMWDKMNHFTWRNLCFGRARQGPFCREQRGGDAGRGCRVCIRDGGYVQLKATAARRRGGKNGRQVRESREGAMATAVVQAPAAAVSSGRSARLGGIPTIDVGGIFLSCRGEDEGGEGGGREERSRGRAMRREEVVREIVRAAEEWGFFQVVNHGVPPAVTEAALAAMEAFCGLPCDVKCRARQAPGTQAPLRTGFIDDDRTHGELNHRERLCFCVGPWSPFNVWPDQPPNLRFAFEAYMVAAENLVTHVLELVSEGMGLPPQFIAENCLKTKDALFMAHHYPPSTSTSQFGTCEHKDACILTILLQDEVGGLEVCKDGEWFPVPPIKGGLVINIGDVLQVWSNGKYKSVSHRVQNNPNKSRYSMPFFLNPAMDTEVYPLTQYIQENVGVTPKYRPFTYKEYLMLRLTNKTLTIKTSEELGIEHYEI